jgi:hypothetical protein
MKVALLPVAAARANMVLLQPGGPCSSTPRGGDSPRRLKDPARPQRTHTRSAAALCRPPSNKQAAKCATTCAHALHIRLK